MAQPIITPPSTLYSMMPKDISRRVQRTRQSRNTTTKQDDLILLANLCAASDNDGGMIGFSKSVSSNTVAGIPSNYPTRGRAMSSRSQDASRLILKVPRVALKFKTTGRSHQNSNNTTIDTTSQNTDQPMTGQQQPYSRENQLLVSTTQQLRVVPTLDTDSTASGKTSTSTATEYYAQLPVPVDSMVKESKPAVDLMDADLSKRNLSYKQCFLPVGTIFSLDASNSSLQLQKVSVGNATFIHANKDLRTLDPSLAQLASGCDSGQGNNFGNCTSEYYPYTPIAPVFQLVVNGITESKTDQTSTNVPRNSSFPLYIPLSRVPDTASLCAQDTSLNIVAWQSPFFYTQS
jgi:hypothetical protein